MIKAEDIIVKRLYCDSDIGSCLIGNKDWTFAVPNMGGDGTTKISIFGVDGKEFREYVFPYFGSTKR